MVNITRFHPFDENIDDLLRGFFVRPVAFDAAEAPTQVRIDVKEDDKGYVVHADMPGVNKEDIHVDVNGNQVSISAEVKRATEQKEGSRVLKSERFYGKISRSFTLASELDSANAQAKYADGVLELVVPKKVAASAKQITIQ
ncbi:MAG: Hsp20/alpha crystallin family protein [Betaproteobacteria bacterium]